MSKYTIGIDLGGTTMTAGIVNENYEIVGKLTWATRLPRPAEKALAGDVAGIVPPSMPSVKGMNCSEYVFTYIKGRGVKKQKNVSSFGDSKARVHLPASCCNFAGKCNFKTFNCIFEHTLCSFNSPKSP